MEIDIKIDDKKANEIKRLILNLLNPSGKLDCGAAFKIAAKLGVDASVVGDLAAREGIRIDRCELGQFGKLQCSGGSIKALQKLDPLLDEKRRIFCRDARAVASGGVGFDTVRSTLKEHGIDVKYCQLGCFKEKKGKRMRVKTKTWIENAQGELIFGKGKTEVLDVIAQTGSISKAAEVLGMNYKKCWSHLQILQKNLQEELFSTKQGGGNAAGTTLNARAYELIAAYKQLQSDIEHYANERFKELFLKKEGEKDASKAKDKNH
ncbi:LysR family transcriptional regulator [uncultured Campylobacter sp.]|uniref:winged helix-turn-helix domain-containing protein n=1 Tax=uncultured Campylobacter sp. TaxID=218934 RepID=UPI00261D125B|nr:LysR family transcriptional regulator [uncultured Campylobacter sp.]